MINKIKLAFEESMPRALEPDHVYSAGGVGLDANLECLEEVLNAEVCFVEVDVDDGAED